MQEYLNGQNVTIGRRIREERKYQGLTLQNMADRTTLSVPYLSQIENGHVNINISSLESIAESLEIPLINFFATGNTPDISLVRDHERRWFTLGEHVSESLLIKSKRNIEIGVLRLDPDSDSVRDNSHSGEEFSYVIRGNVRLVLDHQQNYDLEAGDILYYKSEIPHLWQNIGEGVAEILVTSTPSTY